MGLDSKVTESQGIPCNCLEERSYNESKRLCKKLGTPGLAMGHGGGEWCRGPPVACSPLMLKRCPELEALRLWVLRNHRKPVGVGLHAAAHHSGIFQIALFFKGIAQLPAAASTIGKLNQFRSCGVGSPVGAT